MHINTLKKKLKSMKISPKEKQKVFYEFKAVLLDRHYQRVKVKMLEEICQLEHSILFTAYIKKDGIFSQNQKEEQYVLMLDRIVQSIEEEIDIIFDGFNKIDFEERIISKISEHPNVISIQSGESFAEAGLQFIDNICSAIRLNETNGNTDFYKMIEKHIIKV